MKQNTSIFENMHKYMFISDISTQTRMQTIQNICSFQKTCSSGGSGPKHAVVVVLWYDLKRIVCHAMRLGSCVCADIWAETLYIPKGAWLSSKGSKYVAIRFWKGQPGRGPQGPMGNHCGQAHMNMDGLRKSRLDHKLIVWHTLHHRDNHKSRITLCTFLNFNLCVPLWDNFSNLTHNKRILLKKTWEANTQPQWSALYFCLDLTRTRY